MSAMHYALLTANISQALHMIHNVGAHLVFNEPKRALLTQLRIELLATSACTHKVPVTTVLFECMLVLLSSTLTPS